MSSQNNEFEIPFSQSRRGKKEEINVKAIGRRIGSAAGRLIDRPNIGGSRRRGARGLGMPDGDLNPRTRVDVDGDGTIFDGWPGWEQPDPTPSAPRLPGSPSLASGKKNEGPSFPRKPTYGPFLGKAEERFGKAKTWEEFKEIYDDTEIYFFDYETTGLVLDEFNEPSANGQPVQFGVVKMKGDKEISRLNLFMDPKEPLGEWSARELKDKDGNQLTDQWLSGQMSMAEAHRALVEFAGEDAIFGVQNAAFDKDVLEQTLNDAGIEWRPGGYLDTKDIADMTLPKWSEENQDGPFVIDSEGNKKPSNGLAAITKYLEVELGKKHHTADADAQATGLVMSAIINGALERDWPIDLLDPEKRKNKLKKDNEKFDANVKKFRTEKEAFLKAAKKNEQLSLSSGSKERPIIKLNRSKERPVISFKKDERELLKKHRSKKYQYGDKSELGGEIKASKTDWLKGLSSEQISELIVPDSQESHFRMWVDDIAPGAYETPAINEAFKKYYNEMMANSPWDEVDYSPENVQASRDAVKALLDSSPAVKWAFENHGAPSIGVMSVRGVETYEAIPSVSQKLHNLQNERFLAKRPFVRARLSPGTNLLIFNKRALIDREGSVPGEETPLLWSDAHMPLITDAHIDKSITGTMVHEWGHWLVFRALKDTEQIKKNRTNFFGSGDLNDDNYINALALSEYYSKTGRDNGLMDLWDKKVPIEDSKEVPRVLTSYGHVNPAETFAEGVVAYFHPNPEVRKTAINEKLRNDIEVFLGDGDGKKPWDDNESIELALSSGRTSKQRLEKREINSTSSEQAFSSMPEDDRELARLDYFLSLSSGAIIPESGSRKLEIINDFDDRKNDNFATPIRVVSFKDSNGKDVEYTIFATGKFGDSVYVFEKTKLDKYVSEKEEMISLANGVPFEEVGISVISTMTDEREIRDKKNGLVGVMSVMPPSGDGETSVVHEIAIDDKHKRRGLASALFKYHRDSWPDQDLHHSSALSDDGRAFAAATPFDGTSNPPVGNLQNDLSNFVRGLMEVLPDDDNDNDISLSSGAKYSEIVKRQPNPSREQIDSSRNFKDFVQLDELRKEDVWVTTGVDIWGDETSELADSEDRANIKKDIKQSIETLFSYEIELDDSIVITSNSGEKINLGNKIKITAVVEDVQVSSLEEKDISEQMDEIGHMLIGGDKKPLTRVDIKFKISPADSAATEKLLSLGVPEGLIDIDNPKTNIELGRAHRVIFTDGSKTVVSHESMSVGKDARRKGLASEFNARNESLYREIDADSIITQGVSSSTVDQIGATHWARNGFSLLGEPSKQRFIGVIDDAIINKPESFSEEERKRISSLYKKDKKTGKFTSSATAEELIDFTEADEIFRIVEDNSGIGLFFGTGIFFTREVAKPSGINRAMNRMRRRVGSERTDSSSPSLSSGAFDYRGLHGAPGRGSGAPLHDLISADYSVYPEDVYSSNAIKYYGVGDDNLDASAFNLIRSFKGKPNAEVTIYRAVPTSSETRISRLEKEKAHIMKYGKVPKSAVTNLGPSEYYEKISNEIDELKNNPEKRISVSVGDWVTPFRQYAVMHGDGALRGDYEIVKKRVKAKNVYTDGNSWLEWGYDDSKGSLSLSSGEQPKINLSDDEKREIIRLASQRTDSFSRSVVAQYHRNNGKLSNKQWASLNRMTSRGALGLSSGMVSDGEILTRVAKSFERASLPDEPSTPIDQRLISRITSGIKKKDGTPVSNRDLLDFLSKIADIQDEDGIHPGFNNLEEQILPIESLADIFKELGHSRIDVPGSRTKKILGPVVREMVDLVGDDEFLEEARQYALPPLKVWARAAAKSILQMQEFRKDVGEPREEFMRREFSIESLDGVNSYVLRDIGGEIIMSAPVADMTQRDRHEFQYSNLNSIMFSYRQQTPGIPFMTMVKRHLYPNDPLAEVLADRKVMSASNNAATGGRNMAESLERAILTPLDVYKFSDSPSGRRTREMFEQAYTSVAHYDEFSRRYAVRVRKLLSDAGLDPDSPEVKRALTTGWTQIADGTEEPPENGGRFISAALLVRNLVAGLYRPSWDMSGEAYTTPHEFMHLITGQGFTRHGEMASNIGWLGAFGKDVWPTVATLLGVQARFFDLQKEDSQGGDLNKGNENFRVLVMNEIKELLGGDGDDYGRTSQALLEKLYEEGGILRTAKTDGLFEGFNWIDPLIPLDASDLGWGLSFGQAKEDEGLSLSSGASNRKPTKKNISDGNLVLEKLKIKLQESQDPNNYVRGVDESEKYPIIAAIKESEKVINATNRTNARKIVLDVEKRSKDWRAREEEAYAAGNYTNVLEEEAAYDAALDTFKAMYGSLNTGVDYRRDARLEKRSKGSSGPSLSSGGDIESDEIRAEVLGMYRAGKTYSSLDFKNMDDETFSQVMSVVGDLQRGGPESAVFDDFPNGMGNMPNLYHSVAMNIGDLYNRTHHDRMYGRNELESIVDKLESVISSLGSSYGYEKEVKEQIERESRFVNDPNISWENAKILGKRYADEHNKLPEYNKPSELMKDATRHFGNHRFDAALRTLKEILRLTEDENNWEYLHSRQGSIEYLESKKSNDGPSLSSGANKNTGDLSDVRGIEETISTGPINLQYGRDSIGMPKMGTKEELAKKYGKSTQNIKKMFKENYKTYINFDKEPKGKEWLVVHASLQAIEDIFENLNTEQKMSAAFPEVQFRWPDRRGQSGDRTEPLGSYAFTPNQRMTRGADGQYLKGPDGKPQYVKETRFGVVAMNVNQLNDSYSDSVRLQGKVNELNTSFHVSSEFSEVGWQQDIGDGDLNASYETLILRAQQEEWYKNAKIRATQRKAYAVMVHEIGHAIDDSLVEVDDIIPQKRIFDSSYFSVSLGDLLPEPVSSYGRTNPKENLAEAFAAWFLFSGSKVTYKGENYGARASAMMAFILERIKENSANQKVKLSIKQDNADKEEIPAKTYDDDLPYNHPINVFAYLPLVEEIRHRMKNEIGDENEQ